MSEWTEERLLRIVRVEYGIIVADLRTTGFLAAPGDLTGPFPEVVMGKTRFVFHPDDFLGIAKVLDTRQVTLATTKQGRWIRYRTPFGDPLLGESLDVREGEVRVERTRAAR